MTAAPAQNQDSWTNWSAPSSEGKEFYSKSLDGKVVVVSVWASSCSSCRKQIPLLSQLQRAHSPSQLQVLAFSLDRSEENFASFVNATDVAFPAIFARHGRGLTAVKLLQDQVGALEAIPTLLIFDRQGRLVHRSVGFANLSKLRELTGPYLSRP